MPLDIQYSKIPLKLVKLLQKYVKFMSCLLELSWSVDQTQGLIRLVARKVLPCFLKLLNSGLFAFVKESFFIIFNAVSVDLLN